VLFCVVGFQLSIVLAPQIYSRDKNDDFFVKIKDPLYQTRSYSKDLTPAKCDAATVLPGTVRDSIPIPTRVLYILQVNFLLFHRPPWIHRCGIHPKRSLFCQHFGKCQHGRATWQESYTNSVSWLSGDFESKVPQTIFLLQFTCMMPELIHGRVCQILALHVLNVALLFATEKCMCLVDGFGLKAEQRNAWTPLNAWIWELDRLFGRLWTKTFLPVPTMVP
jgi:hypothetical protein